MKIKEGSGNEWLMGGTFTVGFLSLFRMVTGHGALLQWNVSRAT